MLNIEDNAASESEKSAIRQRRSRDGTLGFAAVDRRWPVVPVDRSRRFGVSLRPFFRFVALKRPVAQDR